MSRLSARSLMRLVLLSFVLCTISVHCHGGPGVHKCEHAKNFGSIKPRRMDEIDGSSRTLQGIPTGSPTTTGGSTTGQTETNDGWHLLRIFVNWNYMKSFKTENPSLSTKYEFAVRMGESTRLYFQSILMVNFTPRLTLKTATTCGDTPIPVLDIPYDLYVVMWPKNDNSGGAFASAGACFLSTRDNRPTVGRFIVNFANLKVGALYEQLHFPVFLHEFLHILGFANNLYAEYVVPGTTRKRGVGEVTISMTAGSKTYNAIQLPEVVAWAKAYFNCQTLIGVPLEDGGGDGTAGSHWEKTYFPIEVMNPSIELPVFFSGLTQALLRGTGWYYVKDYSDQYYNWGYFKGCSYFDAACPAIPELYCTKSANNQDTCAGHYYGKGQCMSLGSSLTNSNCDYYSTRESSCLVAGSELSPKENEVFGANSRCIDYKTGAGVYSTKCHSITCSGSGNSQTVTITVGSASVTCTVAESGTATKTVGSLSIECPYVTRICGTIAAQCPSDCNGRGICSQEKKCYCYTGWSGTSCETAVQLDYEKITFNEDKKNSNVFKLTLLMLALLLVNVFA